MILVWFFSAFVRSILIAFCIGIVTHHLPSTPEFATLVALCFIYEAAGWWTCEIEMQDEEGK